MPGRWAFNTIVLGSLTSSKLWPGRSSQISETRHHSNPSFYLLWRQRLEFGLVRTVMIHGESGASDVTWLCFLSRHHTVHHPVGFAFQIYCFLLLKQKLWVQTKGHCGCRVTVRRFWKYFHFPRSCRTRINSHVATKQSVLLPGNFESDDDSCVARALHCDYLHLCLWFWLLQFTGCYVSFVSRVLRTNSPHNDTSIRNLTFCNLLPDSDFGHKSHWAVCLGLGWGLRTEHYRVTHTDIHTY